jgi:hypothetical protein
MSTENNSGTPDTAGNSGNNGDNSAPNKEVKTFTQDEVNQIVSGRLSKEKEKYADYDTLKTKASEVTTLQEKLTSLETEKVTFDSTLKDVYDSLIQSVDDSKKSLIPDQLSLADKIKYINLNRSTLLPAQVINSQTPPKPEGEKGEGGLFGGKYKTIGEYASADPKGYIAARKAGKI